MTGDNPPQAPVTGPLPAAPKSQASTALPIVAGLIVLILVTRAFLSSSGGRPALGEPAPDFALTLFDGSEVSLSSMRGQVVVLNFWASWCAPCRQEAPELQRAWELYREKGVAFWGVTFKDAPNASQAFVQEFGITYPNGIDSQGRLRRAYGVSAVPETFIIDREGKVAWFHAGPLKADALVEQLAQLARAD